MFKQFNKNILPKLNVMWHAVQGLLNLRGDPYISVRRTGNNTSLSLNIQALRRRLARSSGGGDSPSVPRKAYPVADAGAGTTISCYLDTDTTGDIITVNCSIAGGSDLNEATPALTNGLLILVNKFGSDWHCTTVFQAYEECTCEQADAVFNSVTIASDEKLTLSGVGGDTFIRHNSADGEVEHTVEGDTVTTW